MQLPVSLLESGKLGAWATSVEPGKPVRLGHLSSEVAACLAAALFRAHRAPLLVAAGRHKEMERAASVIEAWLGPGVVWSFPALELCAADAIPDETIKSERLGVLHRLMDHADEPCVVVGTHEAFAQTCPSPASLASSAMVVSAGQEVNLVEIKEKLVASGYLVVGTVDGRGQFASRGGVLDIFSPQAESPVRLEFFGDTVESIREFSPSTQLKIREVSDCTIQFDTEPAGLVSISDYTGGAHLDVNLLDEGEPEDGDGFFVHDFLRASTADPVLAEQRFEWLCRHISDWAQEGWHIHIACHNEGERERLKELLAASPAAGHLGAVAFHMAQVATGLGSLEDKWVLLSDAEIFGRYQNRVVSRRSGMTTAASAARAGQFEEWEPGDYVVHLQNGIGRFWGVKKFPVAGEVEQEVLEIEYAGEAKFYVPIEQSYLVSRYVGSGRKKPELDTLGGNRWERARAAARKSIYDYAARLLQIHAEREVHWRDSFPPDTKWQREFEDAFIYKETPDQILAIADSKKDMESPHPMDRLICGDVGFGKTEVAVRAAFKCVMSGKQVAFLCPTTVLAQQHGKNLRERFADYPVRVEILSRFTGAKEVKKIIEGLGDGSVDVVVGTHKILSKDAIFKNAGLLIVDEEQRFGVRHKERMKENFRLIDILTLSATPIPRTLYLAMMGARDMSTIDTPPSGRLPVETTVAAYDERIVRDAVKRELARDGQVYFLHNRVASIEQTAARIAELVPGARVLVGHGQMADDELEEVMVRFVRGEADVLVSTTIIESGLDIPNANTIIIDRADRFGLADLYQLRGRVGRGQHKAYAYLLLPRHLMTTADARKRTGAIRQYSHLGAGFKIAMRDLEIRGAGNLLGTQQSGHIAAIGFDLYCQLLRQAVEQLRKGKPIFRREVPVRIDFIVLNEAEAPEDRAPAYLPAAFLPDTRQRIAAYRELAECSTVAEVEKIAMAWRDRFGAFTAPVENLLQVARIKCLCAERGVDQLESSEGQVRIKKNGDFLMVGTRFPRLDVDAEPSEQLADVLLLVEKMA